MKVSQPLLNLFTAIRAVLQVPSYDLILFFCVGFAMHRSRLWLGGVILAFVAEKISLEWGAAILSRRHSRDASSWFTTWFGGTQPRFSGELREIDECSLAQFVSLDTINLLLVPGLARYSLDSRLGKRLGKRIGMKMPAHLLRVFVAAPQSGEPELGGHRSYSSFYNASIVLLRDYPSLDDSMSLFPLYHEIGHLTVSGIFTSARRYTRMISASFTTIVVGFALGISWLLIPLLLWCALRLVRTLDFPAIEAEMGADWFALSLLRDRAKIADVIDCHKDAWGEVALRPFEKLRKLRKTDRNSLNTWARRRMETTTLSMRLAGMEKWRGAAEKGDLPIRSHIFDSSYLLGYTVMCASAYTCSHLSFYLLLAMGSAIATFVLFGPLTVVYKSVRDAEEALEKALERYLVQQRFSDSAPDAALSWLSSRHRGVKTVRLNTATGDLTFESANGIVATYRLHIVSESNPVVQIDQIVDSVKEAIMNPCVLAMRHFGFVIVFEQGRRCRNIESLMSKICLPPNVGFVAGVVGHEANKKPQFLPLVAMNEPKS